MKSIRTIVLGAAALVCLAGGAQAYTHHPSTPAERAQTKALNEEQLKLAQDGNTGMAMNSNSMATDSSSDMAATSSNTDATLTRPPGSGPTSGR